MGNNLFCEEMTSHAIIGQQPKCDSDQSYRSQSSKQEEELGVWTTGRIRTSKPHSSLQSHEASFRQLADQVPDIPFAFGLVHIELHG